LSAYVIAAADAFEVMTSRQSYREALSVEEAEREIRANAGTQFHAGVAAAFLRVLERDRRTGGELLEFVRRVDHDELRGSPGPGGLLRGYALTSQRHGRQLAVLQRLALQISSVLDIDE